MDTPFTCKFSFLFLPQVKGYQLTKMVNQMKMEKVSSHIQKVQEKNQVCLHHLHADYPRTATLLPELIMANSSDAECDILYEKFKVNLEHRKYPVKLRGVKSVPNDIISGNLCMYYYNSAK